MSKLRPECGTARPGDGYTHVPTDTALYLILNSVNRRRGLIHGRLHDGYGGHCAMGAFWTDNPHLTVDGSLVDEVASVNDSIPPGSTPKERWKKVVSWLRWKKRVLANTTVVARVDK